MIVPSDPNALVRRSRSTDRNGVGEGRKIGEARRTSSNIVGPGRSGAAAKSAWRWTRRTTNIFGPDVDSLDPETWYETESGQTLMFELRKAKLTAHKIFVVSGRISGKCHVQRENLGPFRAKKRA